MAVTAADGPELIVGGTETTKHLIGNLFFNLCATSGAYERVRADRSLVPVAIEEALRLDGPAQIMFRVPTVDVEIRGCPIPAGATVAVLLSCVGAMFAGATAAAGA